MRQLQHQFRLLPLGNGIHHDILHHQSGSRQGIPYDVQVRRYALRMRKLDCSDILCVKLGCNQNYTSLQGMILDRNQQGPCHMTIDVPKNMTISIYFLTFSFADSQNCDNSGMEVNNSE